MNFFDKMAFACALVCVVISAVDRDYTEMMAWIVVVLWNVREYARKEQ